MGWIAQLSHVTCPEQNLLNFSPATFRYTHSGHDKRSVVLHSAFPSTGLEWPLGGLPFRV